MACAAPPLSGAIEAGGDPPPVWPNAEGRRDDGHRVVSAESIKTVTEVRGNLESGGQARHAPVTNSS
jgi:hypothetical protein